MSGRERRALHDLGDDDLGSALKSAAAEMFPPTPDLASFVTARLESGQRDRRPRARRSGVFAAAALLAVLLVGPFFFSPALREAAADFFGVPGVEIEVIEEQPSAVLSPPELGVEVDLTAVRSEVPFAVRVPATLGAPDRVYLDRDVAGGLVSLVYAASSRLPEAEETGVGLLVMQFEGTVEGSFMKKISGPETEFELVTVDGGTAYWLSGAPHPISYEASDGTFGEVPARLAANTLLFTRDGITYRIEGDILLERAVAIAESLR